MNPTAGTPSTTTEPKLVELASGRAFTLRATTTIGRDPTSAVCLSDMMVGQRHAEVRRTPEGRYQLVDLGSRHGTYVGGRRVGTVLLECGDEILIGGSRLRFDPGGAPAATSVRGDSRQRGRVRRVSVREAARFAPAKEIGAREELVREYEKLRAALEVSRTIGVEHDLTTLLERLLSTAFDLLPAERGAVLLLASGGPVAEISRSRSSELEPLRLPSSLIQEVLTAQAGVLTANAEFDDRFSRSSSIVGQGIRSAMCVPMLYRGLADSDGRNPPEILGIMYLDSRVTAGAFSARDLDLFASIANQAALALKSAVLVQHIRAAKAAEGRRLEQVVRNLPSGVILLDAERRIILVNPQAQGILDLLGGPRTGEVLDRVGSHSIADVLAAAGKGELEIVVAGPPRRILVVSSAAFASGIEKGTVLTLREVTAEREREMRDAHEERLTLLGRMAGGVAHDFNNLLTIIIASTEFALTAAAKETQLSSDLQFVRDAAERAAGLTRQLLAFGRRELIKPKVVDINALVSQVTDLLRRTLGSSIEISSRFTSPLPPVKIDPAQFERVLADLVVNARDAMPDGGRVTLETDTVVLDESMAREHQVRHPGIHVRLTVSDTGVGMAPEILDRLFEPVVTRDSGKGTGLGLATAHAAVRQAGGAIGVESTPGCGSVYRVLLPASTEKPSWSVKKVTSLAPAPGATILLAEDLATVLSLTQRMLEPCGYRVLTARNGEEALAVAKQHPGGIDLLLTDVIMPRMTGFTLAERLRALHPGLRVLFVSGQVNDRVDEGAIAGTGAAFLPKPYTADELLEQVRLLLEEPEVGRAEL